METKELNLKRPLNADQENFCQFFTSPDTEFYGNGTQSYLEAYKNRKSKAANKHGSKTTTYNSASSAAYVLLMEPRIIERINSLLEAKGFNDQNVDKQHLFLLNQFADLKSKLGAIKEYNALKKRTVKGIDLTSNGKPLTSLLDETDEG